MVLHYLRNKMNQKDVIVICKYATKTSLYPIEVRAYPSYQITKMKLGPMKQFRKSILPTILYKTTLSDTEWVTVTFRVRRRNGVGVSNLSWSV